jgi:hypothetical protein
MAQRSGNAADGRRRRWALNLVQIGAEAYVYCRSREVKLVLMGLLATLVEACSAVVETKYSGDIAFMIYLYFLHDKHIIL